MELTKMRRVGATLMLLAGIGLAPAYAEMEKGMMGGKKGAAPGSEQMSGMMHDMSREMDKMGKRCPRARWVPTGRNRWGKG
jgi:hypothetical protein